MAAMLPRVNGLDMAQAAAVLLTMAWKLADINDLCPLCLMECAYGIMENAEGQGAIRHLGDEGRETAH
jgi:hypothetical protein